QPTKQAASAADGDDIGLVVYVVVVFLVVVAPEVYRVAVGGREAQLGDDGVAVLRERAVDAGPVAHEQPGQLGHRLTEFVGDRVLQRLPQKALLADLFVHGLGEQAVDARRYLHRRSRLQTG